MTVFSFILSLYFCRLIGNTLTLLQCNSTDGNRMDFYSTKCNVIIKYTYSRRSKKNSGTNSYSNKLAVPLLVEIVA